MRQTVVDFLKSLKLKGFTVANELPFDQNGVQLFLKNPKTIYVDEDQIVTEPFIQVLNGRHIEQELTAVFVYLATDAKQLPQEYSDVITAIRKAANVDSDNKYFRKESGISTEHQNGKLVTTIELRYAKLITS